MIDEAEARARVRAHIRHDDFELEEFAEGWLVDLPLRPDLMGASTLTIERTTGTLWEFPSSVPPDRVVDSFEEVKPRGRVREQPSG